MTVRSQIEEALKTTRDAANEAEKLASLGNVIAQQKIKVTSKLGVSVNETVNGFTAKVSVVDDVVSQVQGSKPTQAQDTFQVSVVELGSDPSQITLTQSVGSDKTDLASITGSTASSDDGFLNVVISAPFPQATAAAIKEVVPTIEKEKLQQIAQSAIDVKAIDLPAITINGIELKGDDVLRDMDNFLDTALNSVVQDVVGVSRGFDSLKNNVFSRFDKDVKTALQSLDKGFGSLVENAVETLFEPAGTALTKIAKKNGINIEIPNNKQLEIIRAVSNKDFDQAVKLAEKYSDRPIAEIRDELKQIDASGSTAIAEPVAGVESNVRDVSANQSKWNGEETKDEYFEGTPIYGEDELSAELIAAGNQREITEMIVACTGTGTDVDITCYDLNFYGINNFHYLIRRDGVIERMNPVSLEAKAESSLPNNHHLRSILVFFAGGIEGPEPEEITSDTVFSSRSYNSSQWKAYDRLLRSAYKSYPGLQVFGWNDINPTEAKGQPFFNVIEYSYNKYKKELVIKNLQNAEPLKSSELVTYS